jgi:outer membrane receptor for ferrienterochelin and colicins
VFLLSKAISWKKQKRTNPRNMKKLSCFLFFIAILNGASGQQQGLRGRVSDELSGSPLSGVSVAVKGTSLSAITDKNGFYFLENSGAQKLTLVFSYVGYESKEVTIVEGHETVMDVSLSVAYKMGDAVVVSASRRPEKITDAPASVQVIGQKDLQQFTGSNTFELLSRLQGVEFVRMGVDYSLINARGMNNAFNNKVFQLVDNRNSTTPLSGSLPMQNGFTLQKDDIERIEVVLGPQTALYGPNAHNAIINFIPKDPRKTGGTTASVSAGNQSQFSVRLRHAAKVNRRWAYKISGEYTVGRDFEFYDSVYAGGGPNKVFGDTVAIPERNVRFDFKHVRGEGHVYYSLTPTADIILSGGASYNNFINVNTTGRLQARGLTYQFLQVRYVSKRLFLNVYNTWAGFGNSHNIYPYTMDYWNRTNSRDTVGPRRRLTPEEAEKNAMRYGIRLKENSERLNGEAQYNTKFQKAGLFLVAGLSYQQDRPRAYGIALVDSFQRIKIDQYGAALQLEKSLLASLRFIAAGRWDYNSNFGHFFSPKLGLVKKAGNGNMRLTWGRAYSMPTIIFQYGNVNGLFYGNGKGITYIPNGTKLSEAKVNITTPIKPEQVNTWELGYKGSASKKLFVDVSAYHGLSKNFFSPAVAVPGRALLIGTETARPFFPGDTTSNGMLRNAQFTTVFNFGDVRVYGADAGISYVFNQNIDLTVRYSWIDSDIKEGKPDNDANGDGFVAADERSLNAATHRAVVILGLQNLYKRKMFATLSARYTSPYDFYSGNQISTEAGKGKRGSVYGGKGLNGQPRNYVKNFDWGPLGGYTIVDLSAGYRFNPRLSAGVNITNLFNAEQREFVGSPAIRRLIMFELKVQVPDKY